MAELIEANNYNNREPANENNDESESSDHEPELQFRPIVQLPEVEVRTNEECETVLLKMRAKLYRFDTSCEPSEWKERGTGEMKILQHNDNNSVRIVMRRDKTYKVCANHFITPWITLKPCNGSERAFVYTVAADFADEEAKRECLAIKFATVDNAKLFKSKFEEAKQIISTKCCLYNGECDKESSDEEDQEDEEDDEEEKELDVTGKLSKLDVNTSKEDDE